MAGNSTDTGSGWQADNNFGRLLSATPSYTWTTKPDPANSNLQTIFISDVGVGGSFWYSNGVKWRPVNGSVTLKNLVTPVSNNAAPKVVLDSCLLQAGLWLDGDIIRFSYLKERTGGTSDTDATDVMIGSAAATVGVTTGLSTSALATTNIQLGLVGALRKESATTVRPVSIPGSGAFGASTAANTVVTVTNMDTGNSYLQITSDLTTAGGEIAWLRAFTVELLAGS